MLVTKETQIITSRKGEWKNKAEYHVAVWCGSVGDNDSVMASSYGQVYVYGTLEDADRAAKELGRGGMELSKLTDEEPRVLGLREE